MGGSDLCIQAARPPLMHAAERLWLGGGGGEGTANTIQPHLWGARGGRRGGGYSGRRLERVVEQGGRVGHGTHPSDPERATNPSVEDGWDGGPYKTPVR